MKLCYFYDANFTPLRDQFVASLDESGNAGAFVLEEDLLEDLGTLKFRAGGGMPTYLYKSAKICKALDEVADGEVFVFMDVDIQFLGPVRSTLEACMASGVDMILQKEFEDIGVNIGFMGMRNTKGLRAFWKYVHAEIVRTQALDQRVVNNALYSGFAASEFGLSWDRWPSSIWASSIAFSGPLPETVLVHHANFLLERAASADPQPKCKQLQCLRDAVLQKSEAAKTEWDEYMAKVPLSEAMLDYRDRHFGARRPGPEWSTLPEGHIARPGGFSEKAAKKAAKRATDQASEL